MPSFFCADERHDPAFAGHEAVGGCRVPVTSATDQAQRGLSFSMSLMRVRRLRVPRSAWPEGHDRSRGLLAETARHGALSAALSPPHAPVLRPLVL
jgi:hypothetical protein